MLPVKLPNLPKPNAAALAAVTIGTTGLILFSPNPLMRMAGLAGLSGVGAIAHRRVAGRSTAKILGLAEAQWGEDVIAARAAGVAEGRSVERDQARSAAMSHAQDVITRAQSEMMDGFKRIEDELVAAVAARDEAIAARDKALSIARQHRDRAAAVESQIAAANQQFSETRAALEIERDRLELDRRQAAQELADHLRSLETQAQQAQEQAAAATAHAAALERSLSETETRAAAAIESATAAANQKIAAAQAEIKKYQDAEIARQQSLEFDRNLPTIADKIGREFKPMIVCGGQGSGKATTTAAILAHYAGSIGCVAFVLDVSEGGQPDSTWARAGIPSTDNVRNFIDLMEAVELNLGKRKHRTDPNFSEQPPIVFIVDELQTVALSLSAKTQNGEDKYTREGFINLVRVWHTRGAKYGCYLFACNQSDQIQNMKAGTLQIFNGGHLSDFHVIRLNDVLRDRIAREPGLIGDSLPEYLERNQGKYIASFQTTIAGSKVIQPIAHPSHHGQVLDRRDPTKLIPIAKLAACPGFVPTTGKAIYSKYCRAIEPSIETARQQLAHAIAAPSAPDSLADKPRELSPLAIAVLDYARAINAPISARDFVRGGRDFYPTCRQLKAEEIYGIFEQLEAAGRGQSQTTPRGAVKFLAIQTGQG